jgi:hypothetical protein
MSRERVTKHGFAGAAAAQSADWRDSCAPLRQSPAGAKRTTQVRAIVSEPQFQPEILRRVIGMKGHPADC